MEKERMNWGVEEMLRDIVRMKKLILSLSAVVAVFVGYVRWYCWDSDTNHGYQFGYYGEFNRVSDALASLPGITVTDSWARCDITLEEFGFTATRASADPVCITVGKSDRIRSLSGDALVQALKTEIQTQVQTRGLPFRQTMGRLPLPTKESHHVQY
jgi:hypothetical protein